MDPEATWLAMLQALVNDDREEASDYATNLYVWLDRGGFSPKVLPELGQAVNDPESPAYHLDRLIVRFVCARVRMTA